MRELLATVDSAELTHWQAFDSIETLGGLGDDERAGLIAATVANVHRAADKRPLLPQDFFPRLAPPAPAAEQLNPDAEVEMFDRLVGLA